MNSAPDVLILLGMLMLGMALGALLTHIRHKAQTARIVQELEAKLGFKAEGEKHDPTKHYGHGDENRIGEGLRLLVGKIEKLSRKLLG